MHEQYCTVPHCSGAVKCSEPKSSNGVEGKCSTIMKSSVHECSKAMKSSVHRCLERMKSNIWRVFSWMEGHKC